MMEIKPDALVFHNHTVVLSFSEENVPEEKEFWVELVYGRSYVKFHNLDATPTDFVAVEVVSGYFPCLYPLVSIPSVLWRRQAAIEADQCISLFLSGRSQEIEKSCSQEERGHQHET